MAIGIVTISSNFKGDCSRIDADYLLYTDNLKKPVPFTEYFDVIDHRIKKLPMPNKTFKYCEIGNIDKYGQWAPVNIDPNDSKADKRLLKKIRGGDIILPEGNTILLSKTRIYLKKIVLVLPDNNIYFTSAFFQVKPLKTISTDNNIRGAIGYLLLYGVLNQALIAASRYGKNYPTLDIDDLKKLYVCQNKVETFIKDDKTISNASIITEKKQAIMENFNDIHKVLNSLGS